MFFPFPSSVLISALFSGFSVLRANNSLISLSIGVFLNLASMSLACAVIRFFTFIVSPSLPSYTVYVPCPVFIFFSSFLSPSEYVVAVFPCVPINACFIVGRCRTFSPFSSSFTPLFLAPSSACSFVLPPILPPYACMVVAVISSSLTTYALFMYIMSPGHLPTITPAAAISISV